MPKNLKHEFHSELIRQRRNARKFGGRDKLKKLKDGRYADYQHIYSDKSYKTHLGRARKFADYCKQNSVKKLDEITPEFAKEYLISERNQNLSASTIGADALCINHLMIGGGYWHEKEKLKKAKIANMPKRSTSIAKQREKPLTSKEWRERYPSKYAKYECQIDTIRAFGLRRRELTGGTSKNGRDGLGDRSLYRAKDGSIWAITQGKGGKIRWTQCRQDLQAKMEELYGDKIRPISERPHNTAQFKHNLAINKPFYKPYSHRIPSHIFRADYAQHKLSELASKTFSGYHVYSYYKRAGINEKGKMTYSRVEKYHDLNSSHTIGAFTAPYGAFYKLSNMMGHNRLDVLDSYLGIGR